MSKTLVPSDLKSYYEARKGYGMELATNHAEDDRNQVVTVHGECTYYLRVFHSTLVSVLIAEFDILCPFELIRLPSGVKI